MQTGFLINGGALQPDLGRISPRAGLRRLFGSDGLVEAGKSLAKVAVMAFALWRVVLDDLPALMQAPRWAPQMLLAHTLPPVLHMLFVVLAVQAAIAAFDLFWVRLRHAQQLRMSREDVREELREMEGDPKIKARIKQIRTQRARKRMLAAVPKATVVITNPTHYAVALAYDRARNAAPRVVAKGVDSLAARIREVAEANKVPLVANPPLAHALYRVEVDTEIPAEHYQAVAEIIAYVWRLGQRARAIAQGGMILPAVLRRPVRLIDQLARPLPPLLAALFEDSGTGALVLDRDRRIVRTNRCLDAMLAASGSLCQRGASRAGRWRSRWRADPRGGCQAAGRRGGPAASGAPTGGRVGRRGTRRPDGPAAGTVRPGGSATRCGAALAAALRGDPPPPLQVRLSCRDPAAAPVVALSMAPLRESDGEISGLLLRLTDVSVEKRLEAELAQLQKLQAVGQLAGGIAHDFNNLLTAIGAAADSVLERDNCSRATLDDMRQIRQSADRGAALVRQLLAFGRRQPLLPAVVAVNAAVRNLSDMLGRLLGERIRLQLELEEPGRSVRVDPTQLDQVLVNLAVNARDAMPAGGTLTLRTGHLTLYGPRQVGSETMPPGRYVAISVEDTGEGIPPAILPQVFEPFFTTRRDRGGSGLGLSTVLGIVRQSGGFVTVESAVGQGTCVRFWLPRHEETEVISGDPADRRLAARPTLRCECHRCNRPVPGRG